MEWLEINPIPEDCKACQEEDCYNCNIAGMRWTLSREDELNVQRKGLLRAIDRLQKKVSAIEKELLDIAQK